MELLNHKPGLYDNLPLNNVPIYPIKQKCKFTHKVKYVTKITREFQRTQLPITPAFALTEFKCQVDLDGGKIGASVYVMLSRVQRLEDIMILRPFNRTKTNIMIDLDLEKELKRFEEISKITDQLFI
ncbi:4084_t:CDS:2 [Racocetra persica]|uniref:4084_t:CDS:1 n=1 Tax=Racocetra persica TaxID=160502 RepID=A0ACA9SZF3_9GLOM|nr:4084_t:CDS:2 [Racocetra persica]